MPKPKQQNRVSIVAENLSAQILATLDPVLDDSVDAKVWERTVRSLERLMQKCFDCKEQLADMAAFFKSREAFDD